VAGAMALGVMATPQAFEYIATELEVAPVQDVRRAITETLAGNPEEGYSMLYQAIHVAGDEDDFIKLRRAAVFGLARVKTNWALIALNEVLLDANEQDYVQLAAEITLENIYLQSRQGIHSYPAPDNINWLASWREVQEMTGKLPEDHKSGNPLLVFALMQQKEPELRRLAAVAVGQYGVVEAARTLYQALADPQELIRDAAFRALGQIQMRVGKPLPLPV
jgi:HEAT repeat protein